ncbi:MAG TPA: carbon-nitrogen hydrolase family protein [Steroidobacter sp.]|uniref:carbon-nitrogen hydrolase family protein n=1 Tax=Steroidobacter sp. TaxID=1978227 RepID=UPI002ED7D471
MTDAKPATGLAGSFHCACVQMISGPDAARNLAEALEFGRSSAAARADFLAYPEAVDLLDPDADRVKAHAQPLDRHEFVLGIRRLAVQQRQWILIGSVTARSANGAIVNRSVLIEPRGEIVATYDKIHLFDAPVNRDNPVPESVLYRAGETARVFSLPWTSIGLSICYDLRFPLLFRALTRHGAKVLCIPAAFLQSTGEAHWHTLLRARAIENGCYVIAPAQVGVPHEGRRNYGHSLIVDPWGRVLADAGDRPGVISADIDLAVVDASRAALPCLIHERTFTMNAPGVAEVDVNAHA